MYPNRVTVFAGNLPNNTKRQKIEKLFSNFGEVISVRIRTSNGARVFRSQVKNPKVKSLIAFIDLPTLAEAEASLALNGEKINDNVIRVNLKHNKGDTKHTVFIGNLKYG